MNLMKFSDYNVSRTFWFIDTLLPANLNQLMPGKLFPALMNRI